MFIFKKSLVLHCTQKSGKIVFTTLVMSCKDRTGGIKVDVASIM